MKVLVTKAILSKARNVMYTGTAAALININVGIPGSEEEVTRIRLQMATAVEGSPTSRLLSLGNEFRSHAEFICSLLEETPGSET